MELIPNWRTGSAKWQFWGLWHPPLPPTSALLLNLTCLGPLPPNLPFLNSPPRCHSWFPDLTCPTLGLFTPPQPPPTRPNPALFSSDAQHGLKFQDHLWGEEHSQDSSWPPSLPLEGGKRARGSRVSPPGWRIGLGWWGAALSSWYLGTSPWPSLPTWKLLSSGGSERWTPAGNGGGQSLRLFLPHLNVYLTPNFIPTPN